jgi:hypothetical protein
MNWQMPSCAYTFIGVEHALAISSVIFSEERAWERRIQRLVSSLEQYGRRRSIEEVRTPFREASEEFATPPNHPSYRKTDRRS